MEAEIRLNGRRFDFTVPLGEGPATVTAGGATIEELARPEDDALTVFEGNALIRLDVPVLFNGWKKRNSIWPQVRRILDLCRGEDGERPPDFEATGPIPYSGNRFVMESPEWGEGLRGREGSLLRQALVLKLVEFNDPDLIRVRGRKRMGISQVNRPLTIRLPRAETLQEVSADVYGHPGRAKEIGDLNEIRDIRRKLPAGRVLRLP